MFEWKLSYNKIKVSWSNIIWFIDIENNKILFSFLYFNCFPFFSKETKKKEKSRKKIESFQCFYFPKNFFDFTKHTAQRLLMGVTVCAHKCMFLTPTYHVCILCLKKSASGRNKTEYRTIESHSTWKWVHFYAFCRVDLAPFIACNQSSKNHQIKIKKNKCLFLYLFIYLTI